MTVLALTSLTGSPGVTTTAIGWALHGPNPTVLVEADLTGGSPILAGPFRGSRSHTTSITSLALRPDTMSLIDHLWSQTVLFPERDDRHLLPGIAESSQAGALTGVWAPLAAALTRISSNGGYDVVVDLGRTGSGTAALAPLLRAADAVVVTCWAHLPGIHVTAVELDRLRTLIGEVGDTTKIVLLPLTPVSGGYRSREIASRMPGLVLHELPWAPSAAAALHQAAPLPALKRRAVKRETDALTQALGKALTETREHAASYRTQIGPAA